MLLPPFSGPRNTASATPSHRHITPNVWQTASSTASSSARMRSNRRNSGASQEGSSRIPWEPGDTPSFFAGSRWPGPPVPTIDHVTAAGRLRDSAAAANVVGQHAEAQAGRCEIRLQVADGILHPVHDGIVSEVGPAMMHVEHRDVDDVRIGRRQVAVALDARVRAPAVLRCRGQSVRQMSRPYFTRCWQSKGMCQPSRALDHERRESGPLRTSRSRARCCSAV